MSQEKLPPTAANKQNSAARITAMIISYISHPVFFPLVMSLVLYKIAPASFELMTPKDRGMMFLSIGITGVFFPLFSIALMKPLGFIGSYHMPTARERTIPLMTSMIFYFWISHVLNSMPGAVPLILKVLMLGNLWGIIIVFLINIFTKISLHTTAAGGMIGSLIVLMIIGSASVIPLLVAIAVGVIIGWARLALGAHQRGDVWLGYIIGILVQLAAYVYMK